MRTLVFIFSAQSNRITTNKLWSSEMSQYFAVQNRNRQIYPVSMMDGILNGNLRNWKRLCHSIPQGPGIAGWLEGKARCGDLFHSAARHFVSIDGHLSGW
jgi:hypothetical protein